MNLKEKLRTIKENNYEVASKKEILDLLPQMVEEIGSTDPELRDSLIYSTFYFWITRGLLNTDELKQLLKISLSDSNLFYHVGEEQSDTVFTRTFSVLIVAVILNYNIQASFLSDLEILKVYSKLLDYFRKEKDYRGYDCQKGWAHSIAHTADALNELVKYEVINSEKLLVILDCIRNKIQIDHYVYTNGEDERLVLAVHSILKRNVMEICEIKQWLDHMITYNKKRIYPNDHIILMNIKCFLRSLYFRILPDESLSLVTNHVRHVLDQIDVYKSYI